MKFHEPTSYQNADGTITGWKATLPDRRPLATPAVVGGRVFLGGGFGSHEFYALDAGTGRLCWEYHTNDDGPTAAVVLDDLVAFNTESCELEVLTTEGVPVWKKWLGDPLMSMPALGGGRAFQAFPDSQGDHQHYLACFDLRTGREHWRRPIAGEVITAPVLADGNVYLATLEGSLYCFRQDDGERLWQEAKNATSSPVVWKGECYFSRRQEVPLEQAGRQRSYQTEKLSTRGTAADAGSRDYASSESRADWLDYNMRKFRSPVEAEYELHDTHVGFQFSKGDSKMGQAQSNLGHGTVAGLWAYQGSKPFAAHGRLYSGMGAQLRCVDPVGDAVVWERSLSRDGGADPVLDSALTPPALVNGKVFLGTIHGEVICLAAHSGDVLWRADLGEPVVFQPAVAGGRVYAPTSQGSLFCLETGDPADDGWLMWGAGPAHNGLESTARPVPAAV
jgi:Ca-activated chloride channel family protein